MLVVRTLMKPQRCVQVSLQAAFVVLVLLVLLTLGMAVTPLVSASANQPVPSSQSPGQAQIQINAAVTAVVNQGTGTPVSGTGLPVSNVTEVVVPNAVPFPAGATQG